MKCQRTGVRRLVEQKLMLEVTFSTIIFYLQLVPLIFDIPIICSNGRFTCSNVHYGSTMTLQRKTTWKDLQGSFQGVFPCNIIDGPYCMWIQPPLNKFKKVFWFKNCSDLSLFVLRPQKQFSNKYQ